jgi:hypothetical protein
MKLQRSETNMASFQFSFTKDPITIPVRSILLFLIRVVSQLECRKVTSLDKVAKSEPSFGVAQNGNTCILASEDTPVEKSEACPNRKIHTLPKRPPNVKTSSRRTLSSNHEHNEGLVLVTVPDISGPLNLEGVEDRLAQMILRDQGTNIESPYYLPMEVWSHVFESIREAGQLSSMLDVMCVCSAWKVCHDGLS